MPSYTLITFGCQMNHHDSTRMEEVLDAAGYARGHSPEDADVVVLNTCSIREKAAQKLRSEVGRLSRVKRRRPHMVIVVAGCVAQQEGERLLKKTKDVDLVLGPDNIAELPGLLAELELGGPRRARTEFDIDSPRFLQARPGTGGRKPTAYVTVMKGCDQRCTFCIVPYTRGPERYRGSAEILEEVATLVASGVREVTLLGQTVNSYRDPLRRLGEAPGVGETPWKHTSASVKNQDESEFAALLRAIAELVPGLQRLRYTSPHPRHLTMSLIRAHRDLPVLARHVHLPVQSGSDSVLKRMIRRYSSSEFLERCERLQHEVPGIALSTDVIVGFPGETVEDFEQTLAIVQRVGFTGVFAFKYSPRPFTPALRLGDDVDEQEKSRRLAALFEVSERLRQRHLESLVGTVQVVLAEGLGTDGRMEGRSERNEIVHFDAADHAVGTLVDVAIVAAFKNSLEGRTADVALRGNAALGAPSGASRSTPFRRLPVMRADS